NGWRMVTVSSDDTARVWDAENGEELSVISGHKQQIHQIETEAIYPVLVKSWVSSAEFSPDGNTVVTASPDRTARIWNTSGGDQKAQMIGHDGPVSSASFSPDGRHVVTASDDGTARIWDAETGQQIRILSGGSGALNRAEYSSDGLRILTTSEDTAQVWDAE